MAEHPCRYLMLDLLQADARRDIAWFQECQRSLADRGWRVEKCEPPSPVREQAAEAPPPVVGSLSPAEELIARRNRPRGHKGPGVC
jgi:hypothetical protein